MTAITIASPTIVRTMLAPPLLLVWALEVGALRLSGVFSPLPACDEEAASAAGAHVSRQSEDAAAAAATARESGIDLVIEGTTPRKSHSLYRRWQRRLES
jgi:hypothetical protein